MVKSNPVIPLQFKIFRLLFGFYLIWHFYSLLSFGPELFSNDGMIHTPTMNPTWSTWSEYIPSSLVPLSSTGITSLLNIMIVSAFFFSLGMSQRINSIVLWYGWAFLFNRNNLIANPGLPFVGWLLLACAIIPNPGSVFPYFSIEALQHVNDLKSWTLHKNQKNIYSHYLTLNSNCNNEWRVPPLIFWGAWFIMALSYTISGIHKLQCQSWVDGSALLHVLESLLARDNKLVTFMIGLFTKYPWFLKLNTWMALFLEISFLPLGIFDSLRFIYWMSFLIMHIGIIFLIDFTDLTLGVLMIHLFTFDIRWIF